MGINVKKIYLCSYGENTLDLPVVDYNDYEELYKQLQQLKAELQAYKDKVKPVNFVDSDEYLKVVVENKQLKQENEELKHKVRLMMDCPDCKVDEYKQCIDDIKKIILKYKLLDSNIFMSIPIPDTKKLFEILEKVKENE